MDFTLKFVSYNFVTPNTVHTSTKMVQYRRLDFFSAIRQHERLHIYNAHLQADIISSQHKTSKETHFQQICAKIYWSIILENSMLVLSCNVI